MLAVAWQDDILVHMPLRDQVSRPNTTLNTRRVPTAGAWADVVMRPEPKIAPLRRTRCLCAGVAFSEVNNLSLEDLAPLIRSVAVWKRLANRRRDCRASRKEGQG
jgi:hypothetical protein